MSGEKKIDFIVGAERKLADILDRGEVTRLLAGIVGTGTRFAAVHDGRGAPLWSSGAPGAEVPETRQLLLEGEPVGAVVVADRPERRAAVADLLRDVLSLVITANLKRMLATEAHTSVVNQSYEELVATNERLRASEARYRELAESLEIQVAERTAELKRAYAVLLQKEKMVSIGQLAAGVAHEINNPLGYVTSNLGTLRTYMERCAEMLRLCRSSAAPPALNERWRELKLDAVLADAGTLIQESLEGSARAARIVADLRGFSHIDDAEASPVELTRELDLTLSVLAHEIPPDACVLRRYKTLPPVVANPALVCQVFYNIIRNALQARPRGLVLDLSAEETEAGIRIRIADNGPGIDPSIINRIFEPFFTTRDVGAGTGMGLAVAYEIMATHGGSIEVESEPGAGAAFTVLFPQGGRRHG